MMREFPNKRMPDTYKQAQSYANVTLARGQLQVHFVTIHHQVFERALCLISTTCVLEGVHTKGTIDAYLGRDGTLVAV